MATVIVLRRSNTSLKRSVEAGLALFAPNSLEVAGYVEALDEPLPRQGAGGVRLLRPTPMAAAATAILLVAGLAVAWRPAVFIYFNF